MKVVDAAGFETRDAKRICELVVEAELREATGAQEAADVDRQVTAWNRQVREQLRSMYGEEEATRLLTRTHGFLERTPGLKSMLSTGHLDAKPEIAFMLVEHVRRRRL